jgi:D-aminoacyl-tRNA deacylase
MIAVLQRVTSASVTVAGHSVGQIGPGIVTLVAVHRDDTDADVQWMARKILELRIFRTEDGSRHFERDVRQAGGGVLLVSNFTVAAATRRGRRPSFDAAAAGEAGQKLFEQLVAAVAAGGVPVATGRFGADMLVHIANDGPATFILDSNDAHES